MREILCLIAVIGAMAWFLPESDIQKNSANPYRASIYEETLRDVSKGVFISEHMGEVETFIGQLLTEAIERHGKVPEEKEEVYFLGEKVYEAGKLKDLLADYMEGYEKVKIDYKMADKEFQRDIVMLSDEEKMQELTELYDSLEKCCK